jgi:RNA polymerase sigma factor for flagellar operon FliA
MTTASENHQRIEAALPLVGAIVSSMAASWPRHVERAELELAGILGLVEAAGRFDPESGTPFDAFARRRISGAILDAVRRRDWAPRSVRAAERNADRAERTLASTLRRTPTLEEIAAEAGMSVGELTELRSRVRRASVVSLDAPSANRDGRGGESPTDLNDMLFDPDQSDPAEEVEAAELRAMLRDALTLMPERHRLVVVGYFLEGRTSAELATLLGVTESRISQLRKEALELLRGGLEGQFDTDATTVRRSAAQAALAARIAAHRTCRQRLSRPAALVAAG